MPVEGRGLGWRQTQGVARARRLGNLSTVSTVWLAAVESNSHPGYPGGCLLRHHCWVRRTVHGSSSITTRTWIGNASPGIFVAVNVQVSTS